MSIYPYQEGGLKTNGRRKRDRRCSSLKMSFFLRSATSRCDALEAPMRMAVYIAAKLVFRQGLVHSIFPWYEKVKMETGHVLDSLADARP